MTTGYLKPQGGSIAFEGKPILGLSPRRIVGLGVARSFQLPSSSPSIPCSERGFGGRFREGVWSVLNPLLRPRFRDEAAELIARFGLTRITDVRADALNEGARKLVDIAMAVALRPPPPDGRADERRRRGGKDGDRRDLVRVLREAGVTAVFVEHDMEVVGRFADRVAVWGQGKIAALGSPSRILNDPEVQRTVIGIAPNGGAHAAA